MPSNQSAAKSVDGELHEHSLYRKKRRISDGVLKACIFVATGLTIAVLLGIIIYILVRGIPHLSWSFISNPYSETNAALKGILPMIINTLYIVGNYTVDLSSNRNLFRHLSDPIRQAGQIGASHSIHHRSAVWYSIHYFWLVRIYGILYVIPLTNFDFGRLFDHDIVRFAHDHSNHGGIFAVCAQLL